LLVSAPLVGWRQPPEAKSSKAVLVTGASTGIGRKITERLAADGYFVYAGARKEADLKALARCSPHALVPAGRTRRMIDLICDLRFTYPS
jgi:NAD(P)-dependent dehydrogenase (short-subunit alcohol dehydrogenase family)